ncbi:MAG: phosphoribosyltransferase [uncultured bacterium (gcode 4)]|uniref:Phosphoribosyltransferase n=1 Tax=uncultured bacterium (gcode 4) TaxID=1234023 RepID=K2GXN0_9BACT|nr:MAG: phosphoribosyltransferase [uncultured bacterium (gcode 4)]
MFKTIWKIIENIFLLPVEEIRYKRIFLDKTPYYKGELKEIYLDKIIVACEYDENLQKDLKEFKYHRNKRPIEKIMENYSKLFDKFLSNCPKDTLVTWIPLFPLNIFLRWYNQTYLIWESLANKKWLEFKKLLIKTKFTRPQARLPKNKRILNLKHCFKFKSKYNNSIDWKTILMIDDVISTWTTANEAAKILKESWAREVVGLFLATGR